MTAYDDVLETQIVRVIGFRAECDCLWKGSRRRQRSFAVADARWHREEYRSPLAPPITLRETTKGNHE